MTAHADPESELRTLYPSLYRYPVRCGVWHPPGWHSLVKELSDQLENETRDWPEEQRPYCVQTKEKCGSLCWYYEPYDVRVREIVSAYERLSEEICDVCSARGSRRQIGWMTATRCSDHADEVDYIRD